MSTDYILFDPFVMVIILGIAICAEGAFNLHRIPSAITWIYRQCFSSHTNPTSSLQGKGPNIDLDVAKLNAAFSEFRLANFEYSISAFSFMSCAILLMVWFLAISNPQGGSFEIKPSVMCACLGMHFSFRAVSSKWVRVTPIVLDVLLIFTHSIPCLETLLCAWTPDVLATHGVRNVCRCVFGLMFLDVRKSSIMNILLTGCYMYKWQTILHTVPGLAMANVVAVELLTLAGVLTVLYVMEGWIKERIISVLLSDSTQQAVSKLLSVTCDAEVLLGADLCICGPSKLCARGPSKLVPLLKANRDDSLIGKPFSKFLSRTDLQRFFDFVNQERAESSPPSALNAHLVDSEGMTFGVQILHIPVTSVFKEGRMAHLLGIKLDQDENSAPPGNAECVTSAINRCKGIQLIAQDATQESGEEDFSKLHLSQGGQNSGQKSDTAFTRVAANLSTSADNSRISILFDAAAPSFRLLQDDSSKQHEGLMNMVCPDIKESFAAWVHEEVRNAPKYEISHAKRVFEGLSFHVVAPRLSIVRATYAWLETYPEQNESRPATLWLQGLYHVEPSLTSIEELDPSLASAMPILEDDNSITPEDAISSGGLRHRPRYTLNLSACV